MQEQALPLDETTILEVLDELVSGVSRDSIDYGRCLTWRSDAGFEGLSRIGRSLCFSPLSSLFFIDAVVDWLPSAVRVLWVEHIENSHPGVLNTIAKFWSECAGSSDFERYRGIRFLNKSGRQTSDETDGAGDSFQLGSLLLLAGLAGWDMKLLTPNSTDHVEFWEGNIFFLSNNQTRLNAAVELLDRFGMSSEIS